MAGAGGIEVGRASIRVVPNFDGFVSKARRHLQQAEKKLRARVKIDPYMKGFTDDVKKELDGVNERLRAKVKVDVDDSALDKLKKLKKYKRTVDVKLDDTKAMAELAKLQALLAALDRQDVDIEIDADTKKALKDASALTRKLQALLRDKHVDVDLDTKEAAAEAKTFSSLLKKFDRELEIDVDLDTRKARKAAKKFQKQYAAAMKKLDANVDLDTKAATKRARRLRRRLQETLKQIELDVDLNDRKARAKYAKLIKRMNRDVKLVVRAEKFSLAKTWAALKSIPKVIVTRVVTFGDSKTFERISGVLATASSVAASASAAFLTLGTKVAAVGIAVGGILPILNSLIKSLASVTVSLLKVGGALSIPAITGAGVAFGALASALKGMGDVWSAEDAEDLAKAVDGMGKYATRGAEQVYELKKAFDFRDIQDRFWGVFDNLDSITNEVLPSVQTAVARVANSFGTAASNLVAFATQGVGLQAVTTLIDGSSQSGSVLAHILESVARGIIAVGAAATPIFNEMTRSIRDVADSWANDMLAGFQSGSLQESLRAHIENIKQFAGVVVQLGGDIVGIFGGISRAASTVPMTGGKAFLGFLSQLNTAVNSVSGQRVLQDFFESTGRIASSVAPILAQLGSIVIQDLYPPFAQFVENLTPGLKSFFEKLPTWLEPILERVPELGAAISDVLSKVDLTQIGNLLGTVADILTNNVLPTLELVAPYIDNIVAFLLPAAGAIYGVVKAVQLWTVVQEVLNVVLRDNPIGAVVTILAMLVTWFIHSYTTSEEFRDKVNAALESVKNVATGAVDWICGLFEKMGAWIKERFRVLREDVPPMLADLKNDAVEKFIELRDKAIERVQNMMDSVLEKFQGIHDDAIAKFNELRDDAIQKFEELRDGAIERAQNMRDSAIQKFEELRNKAIERAQNLRETVIQKFQELRDGAIERAQNLRDSVVEKFRELRDEATDRIEYMRHRITQKFEKLKDAGPTIIRALRDEVVYKFNELRDKAAAKVEEMKRAVMGKFTDMKNNAVDRARDMLHSVTSHFSGLASTARNKIADMGRAIKDGFQNSVNKARGFGGDFITAIKNGLGNLYESGRSILTSFTNGIKSGFTSAKNAVQNGLAEVRNFFPFSPAKKGPFSGSGWVDKSGESIGPAFAKGITQGFGDAVSATEKAMGKTRDVLDSTTPSVDLDVVQYTRQLRVMETAARRFAKSFENAMTQATDMSTMRLKRMRREMETTYTPYSPPKTPRVETLESRDARGPVSHDYSIHIERLEVRDEREARRVLEDMQRKQKIKTGGFF